MKITCPRCNEEIEISPGALLGRGKKTMSPAAIEQRKAAAKKRWEKKEEPE